MQIYTGKNISESNTKGLTVTGYTFVIIALLYSSKSLPFISNPYSISVLLFLCFLLTLKKDASLRYSVLAFKTIALTILFLSAYIIKYKTIDPIFSLYNLGLVLVAFFIISNTGINFFKYYERIVFKLTIISLVLFPIQILFPHILLSTMSSLASLIGIESSDTYSTLGFYTYNWKSGHGARNSGFAWEPGPFAIFLVLAAWFRLQENGFKIDKNMKFYIIALTTTASTTGLTSALIIAGWYAYNQRRRKYMFLFPLILGISIFLFSNADFLGAKIISQFSIAQDELDSYLISDQKKNVSIGRFSGFLLNMEDLKNNPILGYGGHIGEESISSQSKKLISSTSGLGNFIAQFGILGFTLFLIVLTQSIKSIQKQFKTRGYMFILISLLAIGFGFNIIITPIFFCLVFYHNFSLVQRSV